MKYKIQNPTRNSVTRNILCARHAVPLLFIVTIGCSIFGIGDDKNLVLNGTIEADDILVGSKIGGRVSEVLVKEGDTVREGDVLIRLDDVELRARRDQTLANIKQSEALVNEREANLKLLIAGNREEEINRAKADWESAKVKLDLALKDAARNETLYKKGIVSRQERDNTASQANVRRKETSSAKETYDLLKSGFRKEEIAQGEANLNQAESALEAAKFTLEEIDTQLKEMTVRTPKDAIVEVCDLFPGDLLGANQPAVTLILPNRLWVRVYVPENYLGFVKENEKVELKVDSFPEETFYGFVEQINRKAEFTPRNIQSAEERVNLVFGVKVRLDNSSGRLRAGMSADVTFPEVGKM